MPTPNQDDVSQYILQVGMDVWLLLEQWNKSESDLQSFPVLPLKERVKVVLTVSPATQFPPVGIVGAGAAILDH